MEREIAGAEAAGGADMIALGIILLVLCLLFLIFIIFRQEFKQLHRDRKARQKSMEKLFKGEKHE